MTEENKEPVEQPVVAEQPDTNSEQQNVEASSRQEQPKSDAEHNWQEVNKLLKLQQQKIAELEARQQPIQQIQPEEEEKDEFANLDPEDYLTVAKARQLAEKTAQKMAEKAARKIVQEYAQQQTIQSDEARARSKYQDYDYVVENFAVPLIKNDPALAYKIQNSKNPAETAYKLGKLSDDYEDSVSKQTTNPRADKILKNTQRPVSGNAVGSPLKSQADSFSKMSKEDVWKMSQNYAKGS